ncbi:hypothetical protein L228DRAFT_238245 [Xylona heveae TC161]|uniref:Aminoglycoside phosphotransferase domain-containing protein n=1 Tax=Xylona heveae (strain CBS 132557 / TC161) TaxID=1328760 RepID=A0A165HM09_XYLHT|nr:hypothetical protein L228DRAFT_238245 [Xylona heveae TC161]KZF23718.1 hypothetical protein L228DRAFT_238245 [Xylona heveae TC161]
MDERALAACRDEISRDLNLLSDSLPPRFAKVMLRLCKDVDGLFSSSYPLVITHDDLCEMNVLVDPSTGHITGIIDWVDAKFRPFGLALWGVENVLGHMDSEGWHYCSNHEQLRKLFWKTFESEVGTEDVTTELKEKMELARLMGIALRYGFVWDIATGKKRPALSSDSSFKYLDAFMETDDGCAYANKGH